MPTKYIDIGNEEEILEEYTDNSAWLTRKMKLCSETAGVTKFIKGTGSIHGTIFMTNVRIIFESLDGNISESTEYNEIETIEGTDGGFSPGQVNIYKKNGEYIEYLLYCGGKFSNTVNNKFFGPEVIRSRFIDQAKRHEKLLEFDEAAMIYKELGMDDELIRIRKLKSEQGAVKVTQKVVHGDEVTKTEIKDSVVSKSNIGSGGDDKLTKIKELKELHDAGAIDDDEFKQMKKEILGK